MKKFAALIICSVGLGCSGAVLADNSTSNNMQVASLGDLVDDLVQGHNDRRWCRKNPDACARAKAREDRREMRRRDSYDDWCYDHPRECERRRYCDRHPWKCR